MPAGSRGKRLSGTWNERILRRRRSSHAPVADELARAPRSIGIKLAEIVENGSDGSVVLARCRAGRKGLAPHWAWRALAGRSREGLEPILWSHPASSRRRAPEAPFPIRDPDRKRRRNLLISPESGLEVAEGNRATG